MTKRPKDKPDPANKDDILASELALGVLAGRQLDDAKMRFESDPGFRQLTQKWQSRLEPMLDEVEEVQPPEHVWQGLENRLFELPVEKPHNSLLASLAFWRGLSLATSAFAAALIAVIFLRPDLLPSAPSSQSNLVAALSAAGENPAFIIELDNQSGNLRIQPAAFNADEATVPELWLIPQDGVPRSLGVISKDKNTRTTINKIIHPLMKPGATLAISMEPPGGAPHGKPTGPVIATGKLLNF